MKIRIKFIAFLSLITFFTACNKGNSDKDPTDFVAKDTNGVVIDALSEQQPMTSILTVLDVTRNNSFVAFESEMKLEAPNYYVDGNSILFNSLGKIFKLKLYSDALPEEVDLGFNANCTNDHIVSPNGVFLGYTHQDLKTKVAKIYVVNIATSKSKQITKKGSSYLHGWSPDNKKLVYCSERKGEFEIYSIDIATQEETQLTDSRGVDDAPEYSPDGKYIYFSSDRSGTVQIWRIDKDGSNPVQITTDESKAHWFPHISPDGSKMVYLVYDKSIKGHPSNQKVEIRLMTMSDKKVRTLAKLIGGQSTINVNSWSPDSKKIAYIDYKPYKEELQ
jgi:TolB protein